MYQASRRVGERVVSPGSGLGVQLYEGRFGSRRVAEPVVSRGSGLGVPLHEGCFGSGWRRATAGLQRHLSAHTIISDDMMTEL